VIRNVIAVIVVITVLYITHRRALLQSVLITINNLRHFTDTRDHMAAVMRRIRRGAYADAVMLLERVDSYTVRVLASDGWIDLRPDSTLSAAVLQGALDGGWPVYTRGKITSPVLIAKGCTVGVVVPITAERALWCGWKRPLGRDRRVRGFLSKTASALRLLLEHRDALERLHLTGERLTAILDAIPQGIVYIDSDATYAWTNPAGAALLGVTAGENTPVQISTVMRHLRSQTRSEDRSDVRQTLTRVEGAIRNWDWHLPDRVLSVSHTPSSHGRVWVFDDITGRKQIEDALRQSKERYNDLVSNIPALVYRFRIQSDNAVVIDYISPRCQDFTGYDADEVMRDPALLRTHFMPEGDDLLNRLSGGSLPIIEPFEFEREIMLDYQPRWVRAEAHPTRLENGDIIYDGILVDITEHKQAQEHEFELALERERTGMLRDFIESAAHEFRTPLSTISTSTHLMARSDDSQRRAEKAAQIQQRIQQITTLVDTLLLMAKLESDHRVARQSVDVTALLAMICQKSLTAGDAPQAALHCEQEAALPPIEGDPVQLETALHHMIDNARRYTPADGTIAVRAGRLDRHLWIEISDTGPGIADDDLARIFDTFWRQDTAHTTPGFGLGLPIARKIIRMHGGDIDVTSILGQGSTFRVWLPIPSGAQPVTDPLRERESSW